MEVMEMHTLVVMLGFEVEIQLLVNYMLRLQIQKHYLVGWPILVIMDSVKCYTNSHHHLPITEADLKV